MNTIQQGIVTLLRSAITGEQLPLPEGFSLENADEIIRKQNLLPLAYRGACNCGISPKEPIMRRYFQSYCKMLLISEAQMAAVERITRAFEENGIDYMPLKGCNMKKLYPAPELRTMGDADILIRLEQYDRIRPVMKNLEFAEVKESEYDLCWRSKELYAELHKKMFGERQSDLCGYFGIGWKRAVKGTGFRYHMNPEDEFVYIFSHMMKHFRYCGIGANQIVDLYVFRKAHPEMDEARVESIMAQIGVLEFYCNICRLLKVWFEGCQTDSITDYIADYVFACGSFGTVQNKMYAEELMKARGNGEIKNSKRKSLVDALLPPLSDMQLSYNILYKYPILLPVFWVVRCFDILLYRRKNIGKRLTIIRNMTDEKVVSYREALKQMGLDYNFVQSED